MNDKFEEEIRNRFESLTKGIRSVIILTNKRNNYYSNHFFDRSMTDENANEVMLHETVADALHAIKSLIVTISILSMFNGTDLKMKITGLTVTALKMLR